MVIGLFFLFSSSRNAAGIGLKRSLTSLLECRLRGFQVSGLAPVGADVGPTVGAVVVGVFACVHDVRNPEAWPTDK